MNDSFAIRVRQEVIELAPWHIDVEIVPGVTSAIAKDAPSLRYPGAKVAFLSPKEAFMKTLKTLFPDGLENRSFLDCGCNCGAYTFWAKEMGAGRAIGIDARQHWIDQANLIQKYRQSPLVEFRQLGIEDLPRSTLPRFDVTLFKGILHVLPDPMQGLSIAANMTRDVLIVNTPVVNVIEPEPLQGSFYVSQNPSESLTDGMHPLNWFPSGPKLLLKALEWLGFPHVKLHFWVKSPKIASDTTSLRRSKKGVVEVIASRQPGRLGRLITVERSEAGS